MNIDIDFMCILPYVVANLNVFLLVGDGGCVVSYPSSFTIEKETFVRAPMECHIVSNSESD